jgi:hypothetical protein
VKQRKTPAKAEARVAGILGLGFDHSDGQKRITQTEEMLIVGGSQPTHERMQETAIKFSEALAKQGKRLPEVTVREAIELLHEAHEKTGR